MSSNFTEQLNGQLIGQRILLAYALGHLAHMTPNPAGFLAQLKDGALDSIDRWPGAEGLDADKTREAANAYVTEFFAHLHMKE